MQMWAGVGPDWQGTLAAGGTPCEQGGIFSSTYPSIATSSQTEDDEDAEDEEDSSRDYRIKVYSLTFNA